MKPGNEAVKPVAPTYIETFGGNYHRFETTFQPRKEPPRPPKTGKQSGRKAGKLKGKNPK
jgi:hypothetical protein